MSETKPRPLDQVAMLIALEAPARRSPCSRSAYVDWRLIDELRASLGDRYTRAAEEFRRLQAEARRAKRRAVNADAMGRPGAYHTGGKA